MNRIKYTINTVHSLQMVVFSLKKKEKQKWKMNPLLLPV